MSLKKVKQVKSDRGFKIWDLIVYGVILAIIATLFIVIFTTRNPNPLTGVRIYVEAEVVFEYEFGEEPVYGDNVEVSGDGGGLTVTVRTQGGGVNVIYIDESARTVKVTEANCKGKHCTYFAPIDDNNKVIYCNPHRLKIEPFTKDLDNPNIII